MRLQRVAAESPMPGPAPAFPMGPPVRTGGVVTAAMVKQQFPGAQVWRGDYTGSWWAIHPGVDHLMEAASPGELAFALRTALTPVQSTACRCAPPAAAK